MARINLLPWREQLRERRNKEFITLVIASLCLTIAVAFGVWTYFNKALADQNLANDHISAENKKLDDKLAEIAILEQRREEIISRMRVIQDLQGKRPLPVRVWDDVAKAVPEVMYLISFQREGNMLTFTGRADNPNIVSKLVRNLDSSHWLADSKVKFIKQNVNAYESVETKEIKGDEETEGRPIYPEDSYIEFVVTSQVVTAAEGRKALEADDSNIAPEPQKEIGGN